MFFRSSEIFKKCHWLVEIKFHKWKHLYWVKHAISYLLFLSIHVFLHAIHSFTFHSKFSNLVFVNVCSFVLDQAKQSYWTFKLTLECMQLPESLTLGYKTETKASVPGASHYWKSCQHGSMLQNTRKKCCIANFCMITMRNVVCRPCSAVGALLSVADYAETYEVNGPTESCEETDLLPVLTCGDKVTLHSSS